MSAGVPVDVRSSNFVCCRRSGCRLLLCAIIFMTALAASAVDTNTEARHSSDVGFQRSKERTAEAKTTTMTADEVAEQVDDVDADDVDEEEALERRVRRQSFSMIQDLDALAEMLRETSQRRRMQNALAFFNALRKRGEVVPRLLHPLSSVAGSQQQVSADRIVDRTRL